MAVSKYYRSSKRKPRGGACRSRDASKSASSSKKAGPGRPKSAKRKVGKDSVVEQKACRSKKARRTQLSNKPVGEDPNDAVCAVCGDFGILVCCDACPQAYHKGCIEVDEDELQKDEFFCDMATDRKCCEPREPILDNDQQWNEEFDWGASTKRKNHYRSFTLQGVEYCIGDTANLKTSDSSTLIGQIEDLYEDPYGKKWGLFRWYYMPEETMYGRLNHHLPNEIFISSLINENELQTVIGKCNVVYNKSDDKKKGERSSERGNSKKKNNRRDDDDEEEETVYVCRQRYNMETGEFRPIIHDADSSEKNDDVLEFSGSGQSNVANTNVDEFTQASMMLQLSAVPASLPCRTDERQQIKHFIETGIKNGRSDKGLYISGMPGTGKTATVLQVMRDATEKSKTGKLPPFKFVMLNAMKLPDPSFLYRELLSHLTGQLTSAKRAALLLQKYFSTPSSKRPCCVLLVDEIDYIMNQKQDVIYNLFNWPSHRHARLIVVGIANTMDLPERLMPRVHSRMGLRRLTFRAYTRLQIETIIKSRLAGIAKDTFDSDAIEFCARKVASTTGDIRKALQIARRAAEICREENNSKKNRRQGKGKDEADAEESESESDADGDDDGGKGSGKDSCLVSMDHISQSVKELFHSPYVQFIPYLTSSQKIFLNALMLELKAQGRQRVELESMLTRYKRVAKSRGFEFDSTPTRLSELCESLANVHIISMESNKISRNPFVGLVVHQDDIMFGLRQDDLWGKLMH